MTPRQRLLAAYTHEEVDRVPCSPRLHAWLADYYGKSGPDSFLQAAREFGFDPHFNYRALCSAIVPGAGGLPGGLQDVSCEIDERTESGYRICRRTITTPAGVLTDETRYPPVSDRTYGVDPNPIRTEYLVKRREDLKALQYLIPRKSADDLKGYFEVERQFGEDGLVMLQVTSSLCHRAGDAVGVENLMILYYEDHAFFEAVIDIFRQEMMDEIDTALKAGVRHFFLN